MKHLILLVGIFGTILNASAADFNCGDVQNRAQDQIEISNLQSQIDHADFKEGGLIAVGVGAEVAAILGSYGLVVIYQGAAALSVEATGALTMLDVLGTGGSIAGGVEAFISAHNPIDQKRELKEKLALAQAELASCN
jgi:hypothetical protein